MDPTQPLRDTIISGIKKIIPENSPLAMSGDFVLTPEALARMNKKKLQMIMLKGLKLRIKHKQNWPHLV